MSDVFYLRPIDGPIEPRDVQIMAVEAGGCFNIHRVDWELSFLAADGNRMLCWYRAPDAESARMALRQLGSDMNAVWAGSVLIQMGSKDATVLVEQSFEHRQSAHDALARHHTAAGHLGDNNAELIAGFLSNDGRRLVCAYAGADAQSVAAALTTAAIVPDAVWACQVVRPDGEPQLTTHR
jgi:hypothetical protein